MARAKGPHGKRQNPTKDTRLSTSEDVELAVFHPSLPLFASARLGHDAWRVRIYDVSTTKSRVEHVVADSLSCRCMAWGTKHNVDAPADGRKSKKRKASGAGTSSNGNDGLLAMGLSDGAIALYSPSEDNPLGILQGQHNYPVAALSFDASGSLWSADGNGKAVCWELSNQQMVQSIDFGELGSLTSLLASTTHLIGAYLKITQVSLAKDNQRLDYANVATPVNNLLFYRDSASFAATAEDDRYINVFSTESHAVIKTVVAEASAKSASQAAGVLAIRTASNEVELFSVEDDSLAAAGPAKRNKLRVATCKAKIRVARATNDIVELSAITMRASGELILSWLEGERPLFETVRVAEGGKLLLDGDREIIRAPLPRLGQVNANGNSTTQDASTAYQDGFAVVTTGNDVGIAFGDFDDADAPREEADDTCLAKTDDAAEPTLAERLQALDVQSQVALRPKATALMAPAASSLTTVLTQALRSTDHALLESCLQHSDSDIILETAKRLDPTLAAALLEQLAMRLSKRPSRANELSIWIRWTIVVHGGHLSGLPQLVRSLASLNGVLTMRVQQLPRLLALQGRLDMVQAQVALRKSAAHRSRQQLLAGGDSIDYDESESDEDALADDDSDGDAESDLSEEFDDADIYNENISEDEADDDGSDIDEDDGDFSADEIGAATNDRLAALDASMETGRSPTASQADSDADDED
ncbi:Small subunit (SSU) processome component [Savitreella phatthalungensis]